MQMTCTADIYGAPSLGPDIKDNHMFASAQYRNPSVQTCEVLHVPCCSKELIDSTHTLTTWWYLNILEARTDGYASPLSYKTLVPSGTHSENS